jgi:hypothetical protein
MTDKKPVDYDELFPGRFLKAGLFKGKKVTLTITDIDIEEMPQEKGKDRVRGIVSFKETKLQWVMVKTNGECVKAMFGKSLKGWIGKRIVLQSEKDYFGRDIVDAIRVWGSPDIETDMDIEIKLPRKKPRQRTLHAVQKDSQSDPENDGR